MKKLFIITAILICSLNYLYSQQCLPDGIVFTTQEMIDVFQQNFPGCTIIEGSVTITDPDNTHINDLSGLNVITSIGGDLNVIDNNWLPNFYGLNNLTYIGGKLEVNNNNILKNFSAVYNVNYIGGDLLIIDNGWLLNIDGLSNISAINGDLKIIGCHDLTNVGGLFNIEHINNNVQITGNTELTDLIGLGNLVSVGGDFMISYNDNLIDLDGINQLTSINGKFEILSNWELQNIAGLLNLQQINGSLSIIDNKELTSLEGVDNIDHNSIEELLLIFNSSLQTCEVESVCSYLSNQNNISNIGLNATNCNTIQEVLQACLVNIDTQTISNIEITPNPADKSITILNYKTSSNANVTIYNQLGRIVKQIQINGEIKSIDISDLTSGIYYIQIDLDTGIYKEKVIII